MVQTHYYFDARRLDKDGKGQVRMVLSRRRSKFYKSTGIKLLPEQWENGSVIKHPDAKLLNAALNMKKADIDRFILNQTCAGALAGKTTKEVVDMVFAEFDSDLVEKRKEQEDKKKNLPIFFQSVIASKDNPGTRQLYIDTYNRIKDYCNYKGACFEKLSFLDIDQSWLNGFEAYCSTHLKMKTNSTSRHLRDIRAVFNEAIDTGLTTHYPFRKYKIHQELGKDKSYTAAELRNLFSAPCYPGGQQEAVDMFKLMFCLIGINPVDLAMAEKPHRGRLDYIRKKTKQSYSIKLEPEALKIIEKYKGKEKLLDILERCPNYKTYFNRVSKTLRKIGKIRRPGKISSGEAVLEDICLGSARTSWATIAQQELGISKEEIAAALGHHTVDVTSTYLRTKWRAIVDKRNREVLDYVFYNKKSGE